MKPIFPGGRGAAVEDIQRRLLVLGHDLGPTGVDGVFLGSTREAVIRFQRDHSLSEDGVVGPETWAALVDATFTLGDRMLYLRLPFLHGRDVDVLQGALNALGFTCGEHDAIFGPSTERAVREFQRNSGLPADGIVGPETVRTIEHLRHVWEGKARWTPFPSGSNREARLADVLSTTSIALYGVDEAARDIVIRAVNLARATDATTRVTHAEGPGADADADIVIALSAAGGEIHRAVPVVAFDSGTPDTLALRLRAALESRSDGATAIQMELQEAPGDEHAVQRCAVLLLDALRSALA